MMGVEISCEYGSYTTDAIMIPGCPFCLVWQGADEDVLTVTHFPSGFGLCGRGWSHVESAVNAVQSWWNLLPSHIRAICWTTSPDRVASAIKKERAMSLYRTANRKLEYLK